MVGKLTEGPVLGEEGETFWEWAARTKMGAYLTKVESEFFLRAISTKKCKAAIDIGAEAGKFSILAAQKCTEVVAVDVALHGLKRLKTKSSRIGLILADAKYMPIKDGTFDVAVMIEVLDYIPGLELELVLKEVSRILKNSGSLIFTFGNKSSLKSKFRRILGRSYTHSYFDVLTALDKVGFKIVDKEGFNWLPFGRTSNNFLIPLFANIEKVLGLRKSSRSPWIIAHSVKQR